MPNYQWHDKKKIGDFAASQFLGTNSGTFVDWEIITLFYSSLHYVDSFLSESQSLDYFMGGHDARKKFIIAFLPIIEANYRLLRHLSEDARYNGGTTNSDLARAKNYYGFIKNKLTPVDCPSCGYKNLVNKGRCEICQTKLPP